jgi:hypothetical protein
MMVMIAQISLSLNIHNPHILLNYPSYLSTTLTGSSQPQLDYLVGVNTSWHILGPAHKQRYLRYENIKNKYNDDDNDNDDYHKDSGNDDGIIHKDGDIKQKKNKNVKNKNNKQVKLMDDRQRNDDIHNPCMTTTTTSTSSTINSIIIGDQLNSIKEGLFTSVVFAKYLKIITSLQPIR